MKQNKIPRNEYIRKPVGKTNPYKHDVDYVSAMGYRDDSPFNDRPYIDIHTPSGMIDMSNTGIPLMANGMYLPPYSGMHQFEPGIVREQKIPMAQNGRIKTPEGWEKEIRAVENKIGDPSTWTLDSYKTLQDKLNEYKAWRENTAEGKAVVDYHNEPNEYVVPLPEHLRNKKNGGGLLNKTLTCPSCGWSWKAADGGKDIATCHKCGGTAKLAYGGNPSLPNIEGHYPFGGQNSKTGTHFEEGGWLDKYQGKVGGNQVPKDRRQIPQSGMVIDKRTNEAYYFGDKGETGNFPVLTGLNPELNSNTYSPTFLHQNPQYKNTPVGYYIMETPLPKSPYYNMIYNGRVRPIQPIQAFGMNAPDSEDLSIHSTFNHPTDPSAFKIRNKLYSAPGDKRYISQGCINCKKESFDDFTNAVPKDDTLLILDSKKPMDLTLLQQAQARMKKKQDGGWLDDEEFRRGGQRRRRGTSKNIESSINDIFRRNYDVFGPAGKSRFNPRARYEEGGWLDQYQEAGQLRAASSTGATPVSTQAPINPTNATNLDWVAEKWNNRDQGPSDWNFPMMDKSGSYVDSGIDPFTAFLSAPQQVIKTVSTTLPKAAKNLGNVFKESPIVKNKATEFIKETVKQVKKAHKWSKENIQDIKDLPGQYKTAIENITSKEGLKRLKDMGVEDTDDFIRYLNNIKLNATMEGSHFFPVGPGAVSINPGQIKKLKETLVPLGSQKSAIDHELGHAIQYYLDYKGKTFNRLTDLDIEAAESLAPHMTEGVSDFFKNTRGMDYASAKDIAKNLGESSGNYLFRNKRELLAHLRENKRAMMDKGVISNIHETVTPEHIQEFILRGGDKDRILSFLQQTPEARQTLSGLLNKTPALIPIGLGVGAAANQKKMGGWLDKYNNF